MTTHNRQTSITPMEFEPTVLASELPQTRALDLAATGIGNIYGFYVFGATTPLPPSGPGPPHSRGF